MKKWLLNAKDGEKLADLMERQGRGDEFSTAECLVKFALFSKFPIRRAFAQRRLDELFESIVGLKAMSFANKSSSAYISFNFSRSYFLVGTYSGNILSNDISPNEKEKIGWQLANYQDN